MWKLIYGKIDELLVISLNEWESKKNNNRAYIMLTLADKFWNSQNIFHWIDETDEDTLQELRTWKRGDIITSTKTYSSLV